MFISVILMIFGGVYLKMKYEEKGKEKEIQYKEEEEGMTVYVKQKRKKGNSMK